MSDPVPSPAAIEDAYYFKPVSLGSILGFDFTSMAEDLPKAPEPKRRGLFDDTPFADLQAACRKIMKSSYLP